MSIEGVDTEFLEILGYFVVAENSEFKIYRDYYGQEQIVRTERPFLLVEDMNDRIAIVARSQTKDVVSAPPKPPRGKGNGNH